MKKKSLLFIAIVCLSSYLISSYKEGPANFSGYDCTGAEGASTGSFVNPTGCSASGVSCHSTASTASISCSITIDSAAGAPAHFYIGGHTYTVTITGTETGGTLTHSGFQLAAITGAASTATVTSAGTWNATAIPAGTQVTPPGSFFNCYVCEHNTVLSFTGTSFSESFVWTAPAAGTGTISFYGITNFVNFNRSADAGDIWNTTQLVVNELTTGVNGVAYVNEIKAFPNPVSNMLNMQISGEEGTYEVAMYDVIGKVVARETVTTSGNTATATLNVANFATGMYFVNVIKDGATVKVLPVMKN